LSEPKLVVEHREALWFLLAEAGQLEHALMCEYLFAAFSLKRDGSEGLTAEQAEAVARWREVVLGVAVQEMLHLALASNLLAAIGGAPNFGRPPFPARSRYFPPTVQLELIPFGERALRHFLYLERPEGMELDDAEGFEPTGPAPAAMTEVDVVPWGQDFSTVGHLYRGIEDGFRHLVERMGEERVFLGPARAQATAATFRWPELVAVTDLASACAAVETIVEQGEGARGDWRDAHYGRFLRVFEEYQELKRLDPDFEPARPVLPAVVRQPAGVDERLPLIDDPLTAQVVDVFNIAYEIVLCTLTRFFTHTEETDEQLDILADVAVGMMAAVLEPLGEAVTMLPAGPSHPGRTAGPSFELFYQMGNYLPWRDAAWQCLAERLEQLAGRCQDLSTDAATPAGVATAGERVAGFATKLRSGLAATAGAAG
jgi:Ferritin-like